MFPALPIARLRPVALALLLATTLPTAPAHAQAGAAVQRYDIPAGPLDATLTRIARQAGRIIAVDPTLVAGRQAPAVQGDLSLAQAFAHALAGSGLELSETPQGTLGVKRLPAGETTLPAVSVTASGLENPWGPTPGYVARRATTGSKTNAALAEIPQSISVIGTQEMDDKGITTLTEALQQTPGVNVSPFGFDSRAPDWVVLRGFDGWYTSSYRDGLIQNVGITFLGVQTEVYGLDRIEVLRGPSSVLFGKGDAGGVVNRVSKQPDPDAPNEVVLQLGRYDRKQLAADVGGDIDADGRLRYRLVALGLDTDTQDAYPNGKRMGQERQYLAPSLRWQLSPDTRLTLQAEHLRDDASDDVQYVTGADGRPTDVKEGDPKYSRMVTLSNAVGYRLEHQLNDRWTLRQNLRYAHRAMNKRHILSSLDGDGVTLLRQARHDIESVRELAVDTSVEGHLNTGAIGHTLLAGFDWDRSDVRWRRKRDWTTSLDMNNPVYGINIPDPVTLAADTRVTSTQLGLYLQDQLRLDEHWLLTLSARYDRVRSETDDRLASSVTHQDDKASTYRAGLSYLVGNGWVPYVGYTESFVPNLGVDSGGQPFSPSEARQIEAGVKYLPEGLPLSFTAALFNLEKSQVVSYDPATFEPRQIGKVRSRGLEVEAKAELSRNLRMTTALTLLDMEVLKSADSSEVGNFQILTPEQTASLWLDYTLPVEALRGISIGGGMRYIGKRWNDIANTSSEPAYTLFDAAVRYDTGPWRFALNVTNLFDRSYYAGKAYGSFYRGAERNVLLTARYRF